MSKQHISCHSTSLCFIVGVSQWDSSFQAFRARKLPSHFKVCHVDAKIHIQTVDVLFDRPAGGALGDRGFPNFPNLPQKFIYCENVK